VQNLDIIISVDTSLVHLAGALGKEVLVLLPWVAEWRWLMDRKDSPWYPTATLIRQPNPGNWSAVIEAVGQLLSKKDLGV
jgi:ADP-heptose:LPS heptosyltransferase